jgi:hypothetical protein
MLPKAMCPGKRRAEKHTPSGALNEQAEKLKARVPAKVDHFGLCPAIKLSFGQDPSKYESV